MGHNEEITSEAATAVSETTLRIRALNDAFRSTFIGGDVLFTAGVDALPEAIKSDIIAAVQAFTGFDEDNDPHSAEPSFARTGEHDCATLSVDGHEVMFKIDYYDRAKEYGSPDPSDAMVTHRVLTVLFPSEY
jgi:hypothetical protein